jgi:WD40 repeat protein
MPHRYCSRPALVSNADGGAFLAAGSEDGKVFLWDIQSKDPIASFEAHKGASRIFHLESRPQRRTDAVISVAYHPKRFMLATAALERVRPRHPLRAAAHRRRRISRASRSG